jgi:hypothetical protein
VHRLAIPIGDIGWREATVGLVIVGDRQRNLREVSGGGCRHGGVSCLTNGTTENGGEAAHNQNYDGDRDQPVNPVVSRGEVYLLNGHDRAPVLGIG